MKMLIDKNKPFYEIQINGVTFDIVQSFTKARKSFADCGFTQSASKLKCQIYKVWKIQNGFKYPVPLTAFGESKC